MPIISKVGARSLKVRLVYGTIFAILILGSLTMCYPLLLMLVGTTKSEADLAGIDAYPRFWFDDTALFQKYVESKYLVDNMMRVRHELFEPIRKWRAIEQPAESDYLEDFLAWRQTDQCRWWRLGHSRGTNPVNGREFRKLMYKRFNKDMNAYNKAMGTPYKTWHFVTPPTPTPMRYPREQVGLVAAFEDFAKTRPVQDRVIGNPDGRFWQKYLVPKYTNDIGEYNRQHGTKHSSYQDVFLSERVPLNPKQREDWEEFVRDLLPLEYIRLSPALKNDYQRFLKTKYADISEYNHSYAGPHYKSFDEVPLATTLPEYRMDQIRWQEFIGNHELCPAEKIEVYGPRQVFEQFVAKRRGKSVEEITPVKLPLIQADWQDCMAASSEQRWEFTTRNFKHVFGYILIHGRAIPNTIIYCVLSITMALIINPLAAYALSQYKPPMTYTILLFCMATMAFPGEVTMIPAFLLLKRFPLWPLVGGGLAFGLCLWISGKWWKEVSELPRILLALSIGLLVGTWVVPLATGKPYVYVSLLNRFAALVLPGAANGYMIFLLKGFFDSLPRELYEAADLDGASQWTKFWSFTMALSKPILAVVALRAFVAAYTNFMMALIIVPDQKMWTLMVWLFHLQSQAHQSVRYASIAVAAIPTFLMFVFCQRMIIRGIIVPSEK